MSTTLNLFQITFLILVSHLFVIAEGTENRYSDPNLQTFVLYNGPVPTAENVSREMFDGNLKDLTELSEIVRLNSTQMWCSKRQGMWIFYSDPNFSTKSEYYGFVKTPRSADSNATTQCANLKTVSTTDDNNRTFYTQIRSIRHSTHANLSVPAISLFTSVGNVFFQELFLDGQSLSLPAAINFSMYGFSGYNNWTVFSEANFTGVSTCLTLPLDYLENANDENLEMSKIALLSFGVNITLEVGSLRIQCFGDEDFIQHPVNTTITILSVQNSRVESVMPASYTNPSSLDNYRQPNLGLQLLENPSIHLQIESDSLVFTGSELVLTEPLMVSDYYYSTNETNFGLGEWGLYSDLDFTGIHYCIQEENGTFSEPILVMSVKRGCSAGSSILWSQSLPVYLSLLFITLLTVK